MAYAGQRKVNRDIDKALKKAESSKKSNAKKAKQKSAYYYAKLISKNQNP